MKREDIISKIKELAYENVNKKIEEERLATEKKINREVETVEKILKYINNKLVYKDVGSYSKIYILVNEKIFFEDYSKEVDSWKKGIKICDSRSRDYDPVFVVNGEYYYDIRNIIGDYEQQYKKYSEKLYNLSDSFREIEKKVEELKKQEPAIKEMIAQYQSIELEENISKE